MKLIGRTLVILTAAMLVVGATWALVGAGFGGGAPGDARERHHPGPVSARIAMAEAGPGKLSFKVAFKFSDGAKRPSFHRLRGE